MCQVVFKVFYYINSFGPHNNSRGRYIVIYPHFTDEETGTESLTNWPKITQ